MVRQGTPQFCCRRSQGVRRPTASGAVRRCPTRVAVLVAVLRTRWTSAIRPQPGPSSAALTQRQQQLPRTSSCAAVTPARRLQQVRVGRPAGEAQHAPVRTGRSCVHSPSARAEAPADRGSGRSGGARRGQARRHWGGHRVPSACMSRIGSRPWTLRSGRHARRRQGRLGGVPRHGTSHLETQRFVTGARYSVPVPKPSAGRQGVGDDHERPSGVAKSCGRPPARRPSAVPGDSQLRPLGRRSPSRGRRSCRSVASAGRGRLRS